MDAHLHLVAVHADGRRSDGSDGGGRAAQQDQHQDRGGGVHGFSVVRGGDANHDAPRMWRNVGDIGQIEMRM